MFVSTAIAHASELRSQAARARRLAQTINDRQAVDSLRGMADELDAKAAALQASAS